MRRTRAVFLNTTKAYMDERHPHHAARHASGRPAPSGATTQLRLNALSTLLAVVLPTMAGQAHAASCGAVTSGTTCSVVASTDVSATVSSGGTQDVGSAGIAVSATVSSGGKQIVTSAGVASSTMVNGGVLTVSSGGATTGAIVSGGSQVVSAGGVATGTTIRAGAQYLIGGVAISTSLVSGNQVVSSGGLASSTAINGGTLTVSSGGAAVSTVLTSGAENVLSGGSDSGARISGGKQSVSSGGVATDAIVYAGSQYVGTGGVASGTTISGGAQYVSGGASISALLVSGGEIAQAGGVVSNTTIAGGTLTVSSGGVASGTQLTSGAETILSGGSDSNALITGGKQTVSSGGVATNAVISAGSQYVATGGVASGTTIHGGAQYVSGGVAISALLVSGNQIAEAGGVASGTNIDGGTQTVSSGGTAVAAVLTSGYQNVLSGGVATDTVIDKGRQTVSGVASGTLVNSGTTQLVSFGGTSFNTTVQSGGIQIVQGGGVSSTTSGSSTVSATLPGATANNTLVMSGGTATLYVGGTTSSGSDAPVFNSGTVEGTLLLTTTSSVQITGTASAIANSLVLDGANVVFNTPDASGYKIFTINGLSGTGQFTLNTEIADGTGDQLVINNATGSYTLKLLDTSTTTPTATTIPIITGVNDNATFVLSNGSVDVGAKRYGLEDINGQYYLFATGLSSTAAIAQAQPGVSTMLWYQQLEQNSGRLGELRSGADQGVWIRAYGGRFTLESAGVSSTADTFGVQFGRDLRFTRPYGDWYLGLSGGVAQAHTDVANSGNANVYPWNAGLYGGFLAKNGWFADASFGALGNYNNATTSANDTANYHDNGLFASIEGGRRLNFAGGWTVEPRVALDYLRTDSVSYAYASGLPVQLAAQGTTIGTVGVTISKTLAIGHAALQPYLRFNAVHAFTTDQTVTVAGLPITAQTPSTWGLVGAGVQSALGRNSHLSLDVTYGKGQQGYQNPVTINVGFAYRH